MARDSTNSSVRFEDKRSYWILTSPASMASLRFAFNEAIKRNRDRFPDDFMFRLTPAEFAALTSQFAISTPRNSSQIAMSLRKHPVALEKAGPLTPVRQGACRHSL